MQLSGIDVSHFQNQIDWRQVRKVGVSFAFVKATEGQTVTDRAFEKNWKSTRALGIRRGAYHFFRPEFDPETQAKHFLKVLGDDPGELPPALDVEVLGNVSADGVVERANRWMQLVKARLKRIPILYTGSAFWRMTLKNSAALAENPLWIAHYTSGPKPLVPNAWPKWTFWQFSQQGKVPGISGDVDLDAFNGSEADLDAFCFRKPVEMKQGTSV
jgi:lysozyme